MYITKEDFPIDVEHQSIEIPNSGGVRQSTLAPLGVTLDFDNEDTKTLVDVFRQGYQLSNNGPCLGWRDSEPIYKWISYGEVIERAKNISYGLVNAGMKKGQQSNVAIYSQNCVEWILFEQACYYQSAVIVPLYDTLGPTACSFILDKADVEFLMCDTAMKAKSILDSKDDTPMLRHIVVIEEVDEKFKAAGKLKGVTIHQLSDIEESGRLKPESVLLPRPSYLATICFTSGTTGNPKGVMLTHKNLLVAGCAFIRFVGSTASELKKDCVYLSYLPLAHVFDRLFQSLIYTVGGRVGFFRGDVKLLLEDLSALKPTMLPVVPRVLNKVFDKVQNELKSSKIKKMLLHAALMAKKAELEKGIIRNNSWWDYLVLKKLQNIFGGRVKLLLSSGAPVRKEVLSFFKHSMGCIVLEGYGQTELAGASNCSVIGDYKGGAVGPPLDCAFIKLIDIPEMGYFAKDGKGEVLVKGPSVMQGYFKDPVRTAETLDEEGWIHTGDVGQWAENGGLVIIDRKKHLLKLTQGEYVSPEKIEAIYLSCPHIEQIFVDGDSLENFLVAIVSPDKDLLTSWCSAHSISGSWNEICENEEVKNYILKKMYELGNRAGLKGFEQVKAIHLFPEGFTLQNGILTPTLKVKREDCRRRFKEVMQKMYKSTRGKN